MNSQALIMMVVTEVTVTCFTLYFFYRVLTAKPKPEPDSHTDDDKV
jgi:hypothetical protein